MQKTTFEKGKWIKVSLSYCSQACNTWQEGAFYDIIQKNAKLYFLVSHSLIPSLGRYIQCPPCMVSQKQTWAKRSGRLCLEVKYATAGATDSNNRFCPFRFALFLPTNLCSSLIVQGIFDPCHNSGRNEEWVSLLSTSGGNIVKEGRKKKASMGLSCFCHLSVIWPRGELPNYAEVQWSRV